MTPTARISVVLSTFNRCEVLAKTLQHLAAQDLPPEHFEVIVSDDGSRDATAALVSEMESRVDFRLAYNHHSNHGPGHTHNIGIRMARAPLILLLADDVLLEPGAIGAHLRAHGEHPQRHCAILGYVRQSPDLDRTVFLQHWDPHRCLRDLEDHAEIPQTFFWANNISFKRSFVMYNGLFRETIGRGGPASHEDVELGCRLAHHGLRIFHYKSAFGYHFHNETFDTALQRSYQRGYNWHDFAAAVANRDLAMRYKIFNRSTLLDHLLVLLRGRSALLMQKDYSFIMLTKKLAYLWLFNRWSVPLFWIPLLNQAEHRQWLASLVQDGFYTGVVHHYFHKGIRDERRDEASSHLHREEASGQRG